MFTLETHMFRSRGIGCDVSGTNDISTKVTPV